MPNHLCRFPVRTAMGTLTGFSRYRVQRPGHFQSAYLLPPYVPCKLNHRRCRNICLLSIDYASRPRLRFRLTLGGRTFPRKPWFYGGREFNPAYRYSCLHPHLLALHLAFPHGFNAPTMLSYHTYPANRLCIQSFGILLIANHFRRKIAR